MPPEQVCSLLQGATLYFIGDSYVRHVFTALLLAARGNELSGAIQIFAPPGQVMLLSLVVLIWGLFVCLFLV